MQDRISRRAHLSAAQREWLQKLDLEDLDAERVAELTDGFSGSEGSSDLARDVWRTIRRGDLVGAYRMLSDAPAAQNPDAALWAATLVAAARGPRIDLEAVAGTKAQRRGSSDDDDLLRIVWGVRAILKDNIHRYLDQDGRDWWEFLGDTDPDTGEPRVDHLATGKDVRAYMSEAREALGPNLNGFLGA